MFAKILIGIFFGFSLVLLFLSIFITKENKGRSISFVIGTFLFYVFLVVLFQDRLGTLHSWLILFLMFYIMIVFVWKYCLLVVLVKDRKNLKEGFSFNKLIDCLWIGISPDYLITDYFKNLIPDKNKKERGEFIEISNIVNLGVSLCLMIVNLSIKHLGLSFRAISFGKIILLIRLLSRSTEIIRAFILDIINSKNKRSNLSFISRFYLALNSILEILVLSFALYFLNENKVMQAFINTLLGLFNVFSPEKSFSSSECLTMTLSTATIFSLLGIVITSYIGNASEEMPLLLIIKNGKLCSKERMKHEEECIYSFTVNNSPEENEEFIILYEGRFYGSLFLVNSDSDGGKGEAFDNFKFPKCGEYCIRFNANDFAIEIN